MTRLRQLLLAALLAGVAAGLVASAIQSVKIAPLIAAAELLEVEHADSGHEQPPSGLERAGYTLLFNALAGVGFGLLLCAAYNLAGRVSLRAGALWGLGGFLAFFIAPAMGLPPSLPGSDLADLGARQVWWLGTAASTAAGLLAIVLGRAPWHRALGALLLVVPHLIGAPQPPAAAAGPPMELARGFVIWSGIAALAFWVVLGAVSGWVLSRWQQRGADL